MPAIERLSHLLNPVATSTQLGTSASQLDGVPKQLEDSVRFETGRLIQVVGILLRLPQEYIAQSLIILYRFWTGPDGGSLLEYDAKDVAAAAIYLTVKPSAYPVSSRQLSVTFEYACSIRPNYTEALEHHGKLEAMQHLSPSDLETRKDRLYAIEAQIMRALGFQLHVALPYTLCINYLQTLDVFQSSDGPRLAKQSFRLLNTALLSPQLLYLTHQPSALATAAIYLAAKQVKVKLPGTEWWEVFDVDREELGFLVVAMQSVEGFALEEAKVWSQGKVPLTVEELRAEIERRHMLESGT
nr:cyclin-l1-1 [Quercus suber]